MRRDLRLPWWFKGLLVFFLIQSITMYWNQTSEAALLNSARFLQVEFQKGDKGFENAEVQIYRVAQYAPDGSFVLTGAFSKYSVPLNDLESTQWRALAQTLETYVIRDQIPAQEKKQTDLSGTVRFENLDNGLYLVCAKRYRSGNKTYVPQASLVAWSKADVQTTQVVRLKYDVILPGGGSSSPGADAGATPQRITRTVRKIWQNETAQSERPKQIAVQLLKDGVLADTVILNEENGWSYTWNGLNPDSQWRVAEAEVPDGYTVLSTQEANTFLITNSYQVQAKEATPAQSVAQSPTLEESLPQTGVLWWPIPILICGMLLCWILGRREGHFFLLLAILLVGGNLMDNQRANQASRQILESVQKEVPQKTREPEQESVVEVSKIQQQAGISPWLGTLKIPSLNLELPVLNQWSYPNLKLAPCRYVGTMDERNLVIAGHNYRAHFGRLKELSLGESIFLIDSEGNEVKFQVGEIEVLGASQTRQMVDSEWDLTLFTCTWGGKSRLAVRCMKVDGMQ